MGFYFVAYSKNRSSAAKSSALSKRCLGIWVPGVTASGQRVNNWPIARHSVPTISEFEHIQAEWNRLATHKMCPTTDLVQIR